MPQTKRNDRWRGLYLLAGVGLILRLAVAFSSEHTYHCDEVFQYLEQAHRIAFGYGYIPWEFYQGARSWIVPGLLSPVLLLCKVVGLGRPDVYVPLMRAALCLVSTSLIFGAYAIGRNLASERAGRLAAYLTCFWYELVYFAGRPFSEILATYLLVGCLAYATAAGQRRRAAGEDEGAAPAGAGIGARRAALSAGLLALAVAIRFQCLPVLVPVAVAAALWWSQREQRAGLVAFAAVVLLAGLVDYATWGAPFASYYRSLHANVVEGVSKLFGTEGPFWYLDMLVVASLGLFAFALAAGVAAWRKTWLPLSCSYAILISHSLVPHKELRFLLPLVPLLLIVLAVLWSAVSASPGQVRGPVRVHAFLAALFGTITLMGCGHALPRIREIYPVPVWHHDDKFEAYLFLARQKDVRGVLDMTEHWVYSGGYYYLHHSVPVYFYRAFLRTPGASGEIPSYVTHVVCPAYRYRVPGFRPITRIGGLEVQRQTHPPAKLKVLPKPWG